MFTIRTLASTVSHSGLVASVNAVYANAPRSVYVLILVALIDSFQWSNLDDAVSHYFIDSREVLVDVIDVPGKLLTKPASLYLDVEGVSLPRHSTNYISPSNVCLSD